MKVASYAACDGLQIDVLVSQLFPSDIYNPVEESDRISWSFPTSLMLFCFFFWIINVNHELMSSLN